MIVGGRSCISGWKKINDENILKIPRKTQKDAEEKKLQEQVGIAQELNQEIDEKIKNGNKTM